MQFEIKNRWSGKVQFAANIECSADASFGVKVGLAVVWARNSGANLGGAPVIPDIHKAVYAAASQDGALDMSQWHNSCGTAHCRAGWVVTLAGEAGKALEERIGTPAAATMIYLSSDTKMGKFPDFYCNNETALADMKQRAHGD